MSKVKNFFSKNAMLAILLFTMLLFEVLIQGNGKGSLFSPQNLTNLIGQNGYVVILATGMLLCILTGGNIDLAVGSVVILVGAFAGIFIVNMKLDPFISIILCLIIASGLGAWQAFWIAYMNIPPFIVTLAGMLTFRGLALVILGSKNIGPFPDSFKGLFNSSIPSSMVGGDNKGLILLITLLIAAAICTVILALHILSRIQKQRKGYPVDNMFSSLVRPIIVSIVIMLVFWRLGSHNGIPVVLVLIGVVVLIYTYFTQNTIYGRYLYAMGGNEKAARLSGINTKRMMFFAYTNMGFLAGVAALVCVARFNQASTQAGNGYELDAIGSCFIGGASAYGGVGTISGAVIGAIFMGVLNMGMSLLGWDQNIQRVIKGLVLLSAVVFDIISKNRKQTA
ncbi:MAG: sugar ABC transporter permease [Clostridiales bacterium]|jgi:putative multiple sugar transport system permease protein|nr:sugar ABC transporter permease [Clostridiales bacterium]